VRLVTVSSNCSIGVYFCQAACETFCVGDDTSISEATSSLSKTDFTWSPGKFRLTPADKETNLTEGVVKTLTLKSLYDGILHIAFLIIFIISASSLFTDFVH
jgi:hypothetical protein